MLFLILFFSHSQAAILPSESLVVVHASRHYHTDLSTIQETRRWIESSHQNGKSVFALTQFDIATDPDWYTLRASPLISASYLSRMGENDLTPASENQFLVTLIGGYHSACLGRAMAEIAARFLANPNSEEIQIRLPMKAIYTGYRLVNDRRLPQKPEEEAKSDISVRGRNLYEITRSLKDSEFKRFIEDTLTWSFFHTQPMMELGLNQVRFQIFRNGRLVKDSTLSNPGPKQVSARKRIQLRYF